MSVTHALSLVVAAAASAAGAPVPTWERWAAEFKPNGYGSLEAEAAAKEIWHRNDRFIAEQNAKNLSYTLGHNQFSDLTVKQFAALFARAGPMSGPQAPTAATSKLPAAVDWQKAGRVTPVHNEGQCGSTWAIATVGAIESALAIKESDKPTELSVAQLMDCDTKTDHGCNGGLMTTAYEYVADGHPLCTAADYPYKPVDAPCNTTCKPVAGITGYRSVKADETSLQTVVAQQPVTVAVDAEQQEWQLYQGGILDFSCSTQLDHALLLVGYGEDDKPYWRLRNQWGAQWGESGYVRLVRGKNMCGVANMAAYPTGAHPATMSGQF